MKLKNYIGIATILLIVFAYYEFFSIATKTSVDEDIVPIEIQTIKFDVNFDIDVIPAIDLYEIATNKMINHMLLFEDLGCDDDRKYEWFLEYKRILENYSDVIDQPDTVYDCFSYDEIYLIQRMVETETYQQNFTSKVNVACVAFNRYKSGNFGKTITDIITKPDQFAYFRTKISDDTVVAVEYAFMIEDTVDGATYFHSGSKTETFSGKKYKRTDKCGHHFY